MKENHPNVKFGKLEYLINLGVPILLIGGI